MVGMRLILDLLLHLLSLKGFKWVRRPREYTYWREGRRARKEGGRTWFNKQDRINRFIYLKPLHIRLIPFLQRPQVLPSRPPLLAP